MPFETYEQVWGYANIIRNITQDKAMPPPFAVPETGRVREDPSLAPEEIATIAAWANAKAPAGEPPVRTPSATVPGSPSESEIIVKLPTPVSLPSADDSDCTYEIVPTNFKEDRWVQMAELLSAQPKQLRQAVVFIRSPGSNWLRHAPVGVPFAATKLSAIEESSPKGEDEGILVVYAAGSPPAKWPASMAKLIPAGADLVFRMQYFEGGKRAADRSSIVLTISKHRPAQRVVTLQLTKDHLIVPAGASDFPVEARGTLNTDGVLLGFFPDMHRLGTRFQYEIIHPGGNDVLLRVAFDLRWQTAYSLTEPRTLKAGTELRAIAWYDNSLNNIRLRNPGGPVYLGDRYDDDASVGFFDVAVPTKIGKHRHLFR